MGADCTRNKRKSATAADPLAGVWEDAARIAQGDDWQGIVQDYVQAAVGKASGLGWLFDAATGNTEEAKKERKRR